MEYLKSYFASHTLADLQLDSYNSFVSRLPSQLKKLRVIVRKKNKEILVAEIVNVYIDKAYALDEHRNRYPIKPYEARCRDHSYETSVDVDLRMTTINNSDKEVINSYMISHFELLRIPVMVRSCLCNISDSFRDKECPYDYGGYFILNGKEKVLVTQERISYNLVQVHEARTKYSLVSEIRSIKPNADYSVLLRVFLTEQDHIIVNISYLKADIPLAVLYRCLGIDLRDYLRKYIKRSEKMEYIMKKCICPYITLSVDEAYDHIYENLSKKTSSSKKYIQQILTSEFLPHLGMWCDAHRKGMFLGQMVSKMLMVRKRQLSDKPELQADEREPDDRDHMSHKRLELTGELMEKLIMGMIRKKFRLLQKNMEDKGEYDIKTSITKLRLTSSIYKCFTAGPWGVEKTNYIRQGVSQPLNRMNYLATMSHLRRAVIPIGKKCRDINVRQLHCSSYAFTCAVETPEGQTSGIVKNFTILNRVSTEIDSSIIIDILSKLYNFVPWTVEHTPCFVNGIPVGSVLDVSHFITAFKRARLQHFIPADVSIAYDDGDLHVRSDTGRVLRPVFRVVPNLQQRLTKVGESVPIETVWDTLVRDFLIVFIDPSEAESSDISMTLTDDPSYDYCEIDPNLIFGVSAGYIPWPNHSQGPRNIYQACMAKQAMNMACLNYKYRFDTTSHVSYYQQHRLVTTEISTMCGLDTMTGGLNANVAVMCYSGLMC